jgi:AcrR family transcriptional regulator
MAPETPVQPQRRDRRRDRHEATKQEILDHAWSMVRADGLAALSLRALAHAVDMEPQSLYTYFASKNALYDSMFADGNRELASRLSRAEIPADPRGALRAVTRLFVAFATEDQARYQLLFLRTLPGFRPSPDSYAIAVQVIQDAQALLERAGIRPGADFDLWTAIVAGLASQQLANDPGGDRYIRLIDDAVTMFADHALRPGRPPPGPGPDAP